VCARNSGSRDFRSRTEELAEAFALLKVRLDELDSKGSQNIGNGIKAMAIQGTPPKLASAFDSFEYADPVHRFPL
jgi:hypothetical protein